jgi:hypothetical protein
MKKMMCMNPMMMAAPAGGKIAFLLVALALGYWVLTLAENQSPGLRTVGRVSGWVIMVVAVGGLLCSAVCGLGRMKSCPRGEVSKMGCPMGDVVESPVPEKSK